MAFEFLNSIKNNIISDNELFDDLEEYPVVETIKWDNLLSFYAKAAFLRNEKEEDIISLFMKAYKEDEYKAIKLLFYIRDIDEGLGERRLFRIIIKHLANINSRVLYENIKLIPEFGRWDDLYSLFDTPFKSEAVRLMRHQLTKDIKSDTPSTLCKWLKSENASSEQSRLLAITTREALELSSKEYRILLSHLREKIYIVEEDMSSGNWSSIKYDKLSESTLNRYHKAFLRHDSERYNKFLEIHNLNKLEQEKFNDNKELLFPYDIVRKIVNDNSETNLEVYADHLKAVQKFASTDIRDTVVCLCLSSPHKSPCYYAGIGTILYLLDTNTGKYKNHILTMKPNPNFKRIKKEDIREKIKEIELASYTDEVNVEAALDVILFSAIKYGLEVANIPRRIIFIMDSRCTINCEQSGDNKFLDSDDYARMKDKWLKSDYIMPELAFWKIDNISDSSKVMIDDVGIQYGFGYSDEVFKAMVGSKKNYINTLEHDVFESKRFDSIKAAADEENKAAPKEEAVDLDDKSKDQEDDEDDDDWDDDDWD